MWRNLVKVYAPNTFTSFLEFRGIWGDNIISNYKKYTKTSLKLCLVNSIFTIFYLTKHLEKHFYKTTIISKKTKLSRNSYKHLRRCHHKIYFG